MPQRQPFTTLCQALAQVSRTGRADLHVHTTYSDGAYTPAEIVDLARRSGLAAVAITDHDTISAFAPALAAAGRTLEVVPGVEITAVFEGRGLHLLGYFFRPDYLPLASALARLRQRRLGRFREMVERLRSRGVSLEEQDVCAAANAGVPGRRGLAELLVRAGKAVSVRAAFSTYLGDFGDVAIPSVGVPVAEAIALVRAAGGVAAWAHPSYDEETPRRLAALHELGLQAVEADYPSLQGAKQRRLRAAAAELGLAVTGGSDCHGPDVVRRAVGACGVTAQELETIRRLAVTNSARGSVSLHPGLYSQILE